MIGASDRQQQGQTIARALKIGDPNAVATAFQLPGRHPHIRRVLAVVVDQGSVVQKESGSIVR